jgi:hypothetical protein
MPRIRTEQESKTSGKFRFKKHANVGAPAAEDDEHFLKTCFVDTGDLRVLRDCENPKALIIGRTGSGKSALLVKLKHFEEHVIEISPFNLAVEHVSNSEVLRFFAEAGVHLDRFYKLLWRHVFTVELIRERHGIHTEADQKHWLQRVWTSLSMNSRKKAQLDYLLKHGREFWRETEERVKETTKKTENELKTQIGAAIKGLSFSIGGVSRLSKDELTEVRRIGQEVVNSVQIRDLNEMFDLLKTEVLDDEEKHFLILIDGLDEEWVDDPLRHQLIKALVETMRDFRSVQNAKIIVCIRADLIQRVYRTPGGMAYQEEKMKGLQFELRWTRQQLIDVLDKRISQLAQDAYTNQRVTHEDLLPKMKRREQSAIDYILDRTMNRPRDVITFFNCCIKQSIGSPKITRDSLYKAEEEYSTDRLRALADEWQKDYPYLFEFAGILKGRHHQFCLGDISDEKVTEFCFEFIERHNKASGPLVDLAHQLLNNIIDTATFRQLLATVLFHVGLIGIKLETYASVTWSLDGRIVPSSEIDDRATCNVHKMFWFVLGIRAAR